MKHLLTISSVLLAASFASASVTYYAGNEHKEAVAKVGSTKAPEAPVLTYIELTVEPNKITERHLQPDPANPKQLLGAKFEYVNSNGHWTWTNPVAKKVIPLTVSMSGTNLKSISRSVDLGKVKLSNKETVTDTTFFSELETMNDGKVSYREIVDAGVIAKHQFDLATKDKTIVPHKAPAAQPQKK